MAISARLGDALFRACLSPTDSATPVRFQSALAKVARKHDLQLEAGDGFDIDGYVDKGHASRELLERPTPVRYAVWGGLDKDRLFDRTPQAVWQLTWQGHELLVVDGEWEGSYGRSHSRSWLLAREAKIARDFLLEVARVMNDPGEAVLVFHGSCWNRSPELYAAVQKASFEDLILASSLKERIRSDFQRFLGARSAYDEVGLAWRRGALFLGPPGNGKTHCLRALVKELGVPALYVQSVKAQYETEEANLKRVFERARQLRPCVLVLEDLDALIHAGNRSFFLNQLDGFEQNVGLIVLATTNHPDRIDPALLDRPSRFDRKYHFELPAIAEREAYLRLWQARLGPKTKWTDKLTMDLAARSDGFSFAYLKELVTSTLQRFAIGEGGFAKLAREECATLQEQRKTVRAEPAPPPERPSYDTMMEAMLNGG